MPTSRPARHTSPLEAGRYLQVSRRSMLKRTLGVGAIVLVPGLACGRDDAAVFAGDDTSSAAPSGTDTAAPTGTADSTALASATALPDGAEMVIAFTYEQASGGKDEPPYIAVWIEDAGGELVETVALWFEQSDKGTRWLHELKRWSSVEEVAVAAGGDGEVDVVSSATRLPGAYSLVWDAIVAGTPATAGDYHVCIESSREHGPYSLVRAAVTLDGTAFTLDLPADGELTAASVVVGV